MAFSFLVIKRVLPCTLLLFSIACNKPPSCWQTKVSGSDCPCYEMSKTTAFGGSSLTGIELEVASGDYGERVYLNVYGCPLYYDPNNKQIAVQLTVDNETSMIEAVVLDGGQRVLLSEAGRELILLALLENKILDIQLQHYKASIDPFGFCCL